MYMIRERLFRLGQDSDITDDSGRTVIHVDGKVFSLHQRLVLTDSSGREVAQVQRKLAALRPTFEIDMGGHRVAQIRKHRFTPLHDRFTIDLDGADDLEMSGNLLDHEFTITRADQVVATISKRWISARDTYAVDIAPNENDVLVLASVLALDLAEDQEHRGD